MTKHHKDEPEELLRRYGKEVAAVEQYWHLAKRPKPRTPPKNYKYVEELAHLQFELIKLEEWVRLQKLKVVVLFEGRDAAGKGGVPESAGGGLRAAVCGRRFAAADSRRGRG